MTVILAAIITLVLVVAGVLLYLKWRWRDRTHRRGCDCRKCFDRNLHDVYAEHARDERRRWENTP